MMNLSSLSKGLIALFLSATLAGIGAIYLFFKGEAVIAVVVGCATISALIAIFKLLQAQKNIRYAAFVCRQIGDGDFEVRSNESLDQGDILQLLTNINFQADHTDAFIREAVASTKAISNNKYYRRILLRGMDGRFKSDAIHINNAIAKIQHRISDFSGKLGSFEEFIGKVAGEITSSGNNLSETAHQMENSAASTSERASIVAAASLETSTNVESVSAAVEQLSASSHEIGNQVERSAEIATSAANQAKNGEIKINSLNEAAQMIGRVVQLINDIAEQTNLLALNATIEAARAGDAGKGFAVVAGEVKELATQTSKAIDEISKQIKHIQFTTDESVTAFTNVSNTISEIETITAAVANAAKEQGIAASEIARNVEQALIGTQEVTENIVEVSNSASQTGRSAETVLSSAESMNKNASELTTEVKDFILKLRQGPLDRRERLDSDYEGPERRQDTKKNQTSAAA